jgi:signal transduction histidine kinase|uniref:histidine kinase n=1 Tax=Desulfobacca acetoxidans TaxID=60893 RepID=A0A7C5ALW5_9BACT
MKQTPWILVVDDDPGILELVQDLLRPNYLVDTAKNVKEAQVRLQKGSYDLVLTDMVMPEIAGMELVKYVRLHYPDIPVIVFTGYANFQDAVTAVKLGAFDYLPKPIQTEILRHAIQRALEFRRLSLMQRDLEFVFQGAEALGFQALELLSDTPEAAVLTRLREVGARGGPLAAIGQAFLDGAYELVKATQSSIFLFDQNMNRFTGLAARGPDAEARLAAEVPVTAGIMGYVATQRRPLLVADIDLDPRFSLSHRRFSYKSGTFMIIPLTGSKFWGVINLTDPEDQKPFSARDLFLAWLLGRLLVEILEAREPRPEAEFQLLLGPLVKEHLPLGVTLLDKNFKVIQVNDALARLLGVRGKDLRGKNIIPYLGLSAADQELLGEAFRKLRDTLEPMELPPLKSFRNTEEEGCRFLGLKMIPLPQPGDTYQTILLIEDVSELEELRQRLHLYEHLAIMGKLSLCVAHELNNPLDGIRRYLSLAQMKKNDPEEVDRYLSEAIKGLHKMSLTIRSLLSSANPLKAPRATDNLLNLLQDAVKIMMFQASDQRVQVSFHPPKEFRNLKVEGDLYHVFINIIKNALQAMPQGGKLNIYGLINNNQVEIDFEDTGIGISSQELSQIFQPFYSTKDGVQGLGLGLPICRKILERYHGQLMVQSQPGMGTKVQILLPKSGLGGSLGTK